MAEIYSLGTGSKKIPLPMNEKSKSICIDVHFVLSYFSSSQYHITDRSNPYYVKFFIGPNANLYLNDDIDGTVDVCLTGPGLLFELSHEDCLKTLLQQNAQNQIKAKAHKK